MRQPEAAFLERVEGLQSVEGFEMSLCVGTVVGKDDGSGQGRSARVGRREKADGVGAMVVVGGSGCEFGEIGSENRPTAFTEHEGEGEGDEVAGGLVEGGGVIGEEVEAAVEEGGGKGRFAGVGGSGEDEGVAGLRGGDGSGVENGEPLGVGVMGEASHFLEEDGAGDG
jgi:hypothetical protein